MCLQCTSLLWTPRYTGGNTVIKVNCGCFTGKSERTNLNIYFLAGALLSALHIPLLSQETGVGAEGQWRVLATRSVLFLEGNCKYDILKRKPGVLNHHSSLSLSLSPLFER